MLSIIVDHAPLLMEPAPLPRHPGGLQAVFGHDFLHVYGGAERVLAEMMDTFPGSELWSVHHRSATARAVTEGPARSLLPESERIARHFRLLTPGLPALVRRHRLPPADVLITSSYAFAHGMRTADDAPQVCFCHSPLRFAWSATDDYSKRWARVPGAGLAFRAFAEGMRRSDVRAARGVHTYLAISSFVADVIREAYEIEPILLRAPIDTDLFHPAEDGPDDYFLFCGRLIEPYKRPTAVIDAFADLPDKKLVVAGDGPELARLRARATANVTFLGHLRDDELVPLMQRCTATIFPSRDDFGLVPLEVMACGRPVIALASGGALETVVDGRTGVFLDRVDSARLAAAVRDFDVDRFDASEIRAHALQWDRRQFRRDLIDVVTRVAVSQH
jgi:glycosyltransferase involved in cell wall biosynthesis